VIERAPVLETDPPVRIAKVGVVAFKAAVMSTLPVLVPFKAPIRSVFVDTRSSSKELIASLPTESDPKSITLESVRGVRVTDPDGAEILILVTSEMDMLSACKRMFPVFEVILPTFSNVPAR
jgi:hypothetical protein